MNFRERAKALKNSLGEMLKKAKAENRVFTVDEQAKYDAEKAEMENCLRMAEAEKEQEELEDSLRDPVNPPANVRVVSNPPKWQNTGEFFDAVRKAAGPDRQVDNRLLDVKNASGLNEGVGSEGGFLVETDHSTELLRRAYETGALASRIRRIPVSGSANGLTINAVKESSRATGSRWGGVQAYWLSEAAQKTPSAPAFRQIELKLKKLIGLCYATDELLQDTTALESILTQAFAEEFGFIIDQAILEGDGVGKPLGVLNSGALVTVAKEAGQAAGTIVSQNLMKMWSRMWARSRANAVWFINQDVEPQLFSLQMPVGTAGVPAYLPPGGLSASPYGTLFGRPVIPVEQCSTVGTVGDIVLADLSQYLGIDKGGTQTASSIHVRFVWDESVFRFVYRMDGAPAWDSALTPAKGNNTLSPFVALATRA